MTQHQVQCLANFVVEENDNNSNSPSTRYLENGSFIRLSNVTASYDFAMSQNKFFRDLKLYITGQNLMLFTKYKGYDPEVSNAVNFGGLSGLGIDFTNYPVPLSVTVGMDVTFQ